MANNLNNHSNEYSNRIDLKDILSIVVSERVIILTFTMIFFVGSILYSLSLPNIYKSEALLSPVEGSNNISSTIRSYGNIASIAGINLPSDTDVSNSAKAIDKLSSLSFFSNNILPNIYLPDLMAVKKWDSGSNRIFYDENIYDDLNKKWVREYDHPKNLIPSAQESFKAFKKYHLVLSKDLETGFVTIAVKHQSPFIAKKWTELIVREINNFFRAKDELEANAAINFLNSQITITNFAEIKEVIAELIQQKTQQLTLIEVSEFYVFDYIDPPAIMEEKDEPRRSLIAVMGFVFGLMTGLLIVLSKYFIMNNKS